MLALPTEDGRLTKWEPSGVSPPRPAPGGFTSRTAYAAVHVVADPSRETPIGGPPPIDWEATLSYRRHLWELGLGVAEAMDTAQRGSGVDWDTARELIRRTAEAARQVAGEAVYGASTDQLQPGAWHPLEGIIDAYLEQVSFIEEAGGTAIVMSSRHLAISATARADFIRVYDEVIDGASQPVMLHWLGEVFDPALAGYWGSHSMQGAVETVLEIVSNHPGKVVGVKLSLLDADLEVRMRRRLPPGVRMLTGDDLNYVDLILGDEEGHSDALLGIFDAVAPVAAAALQALDEGNADRARSLLEPTLPLARHLFSAPTLNYKTGLVFLAYINGFQDHFRMVGGAESARSVPHLARALVLADEAGLIIDPELAMHRMRLLLELGGIDAMN